MFAYCGNNPVMGYDPTGECCLFATQIPKITQIISRYPPKSLIDHVRDGFAYTADVYLREAQMQRNATLIYNYLRKKGWSHNASCAALGNMQQESTINPGLHQRGGGGFGIVQWDPATKYTSWAGQNGYANDSLTGQLEFLIYSMQRGKGEWFKNSKHPSYYLPSDEFVCSNLPIAFLTAVFSYSYERAGTPMLENRIKYALYWSDYFS